jgi:DNA polymerase III alpha subunit
MTDEDLQSFVTKLYEKAYNTLDIIKLIEDGCFALDQYKRYELLIAFNKIRKDFRNEKLLLMFVINFTFIDKKICLENMTFI